MLFHVAGNPTSEDIHPSTFSISIKRGWGLAIFSKTQTPRSDREQYPKADQLNDLPDRKRGREAQDPVPRCENERDGDRDDAVQSTQPRRDERVFHRIERAK